MAVLEDPPVRPGVADQSQVRTTVPAAEAHGDHDNQHEGEHAFAWPEAARIAFVALTAAAVWFRVWEPLASVSVLGVLGVIVGGWPILKEAAENIVARRMTMELSMSIAIVGRGSDRRVLHRSRHHALRAGGRSARGHDPLARPAGNP
jgi:cation transport ATPase